MEQATVVKALEASTNSKTVADMMPLAAEKHADNVAGKFKQGDEWIDYSYADLGKETAAIAKGLIALGINQGDRTAILSGTRKEWTYADMGALTAGATVVPIYQTNSPSECEYVLNHSEATLLFLEDNEQLEKIRTLEGKLDHLKTIIVIEPSGDIGDAISLDDLKGKGADLSDAQLKERYTSVKGDDICTIIYTSGTTGPPKGCLISHSNYRSMISMAEEDGLLGAEDSLSYLFLPLAHAFALLVQFVSIDCGAAIAYWEGDPTKIIPNLMEVKPTIFPSVPRLFEKIYTMANAAVAQKSPEEQEQFHKAIALGMKVREMRRLGEPVPEELEKAFEGADAAVYSNVRALFGGNIVQAITGAAPISEEILKFFYACGVHVLEGYGMTETSTATTGNQLDNFRFGSIGKPLPGSQIKVADDGELLFKGPNIFQGYYKNPEATKEALVDGWLHTGDLGRVDEDGFVYITGRKKDIIITAGGKNITPANFENSMKQNRWISQAVMYGDRRAYLVALVTLDPDEAPALAAELGIDAEIKSMAKDPKVRATIQTTIDEINTHFARVEQVKKFEILDHDLSQETGELTPTLKVKRNVVNEKYDDIFEKMYEDA